MKIDEIKITSNMRELNDNEVINLMTSIKLIGQLQPILVNENNELVAGRHRLEACKRLGFTDIAAVRSKIKCPENLTEQEYFELCQVDENLVRNELSPIERAKAISIKKRLLEKILGTSKEAVEQIQKETGLSKGTIYTDVNIAAKFNSLNQDEIEQIKNKARKELIEVDESEIFNTKKEEVKVLFPSYYTTIKSIQTRMTIDLNRLAKEVDHTAPKGIQKLWQEELPLLVEQINLLSEKIAKIIKKEEMKVVKS